MAAVARDSLVVAFMRSRSSQNSLCGALATRTACTADVRSSAPPSFEPVSYSHRSAAGQTFTAAPRGHSGEIQQDCRKKTLTFHRRGAERVVRPPGGLCRLSTGAPEPLRATPMEKIGRGNGSTPVTLAHRMPSFSLKKKKNN